MLLKLLGGIHKRFGQILPSSFRPLFDIAPSFGGRVAELLNPIASSVPLFFQVGHRPIPFGSIPTDAQ